MTRILGSDVKAVPNPKKAGELELIIGSVPGLQTVVVLSRDAALNVAADIVQRIAAMDKANGG